MSYQVIKRTKKERRARRGAGLAERRERNQELGETQEFAARLAKAAQGVPVRRRGEFTLAARMKA